MRIYLYSIITVGLSAVFFGTSLAVTDDSQQILQSLGNRGIHVHDPSPIVKCGDQYWLFSTGMDTPSYCSKDLVNWIKGPVANAERPAWISRVVPDNHGGDYWAPDVIRVGNKYLLYYAISTFGKNVSAIGISRNATLDPKDPAYHWSDAGMAVRSTEHDDFNALDPSAFLAKDGKMWLAFGSFWSGIKLIQLNPETGQRIASDSPMYSLAHWDSIEAPYLFQHGDYYYLFVSFGLCCRGVESSYNTCVGRSKVVTGPYLDKEGNDMLLGGGSAFVATDGPMIGPGQSGILHEGEKFWFSCHFYDATAHGASRLAIRPLTWIDDWPVIGKMDVARQALP